MLTRVLSWKIRLVGDVEPLLSPAVELGAYHGGVFTPDTDDYELPPSARP